MRGCVRLSFRLRKYERRLVQRQRYGDYSFAPQEGDERISPDDFSACESRWENEVYVPPLTQIA